MVNTSIYIYVEQEPADVAHSEKDYLEAVEDNAPASTSEVAEAVGVTRQGADYRLRELEADGKVRSKMVGNSLVWMVE